MVLVGWLRKGGMRVPFDDFANFFSALLTQMTPRAGVFPVVSVRSPVEPGLGLGGSVITT